MPEILREHFQLKETIVTIFARESRHIDAARESIREQRAYLENFIRKDPFFQITLEPYDLVQDEAPRIVKQMIEKSAVFGIGPMAAVAGAIAGFAVQAMMDEGATYAVVDNGGDICILNDQPIVVGIYAGSSPIRDLAFQLAERRKPLGICTSSGSVGPSISFGCADAAVVISRMWLWLMRRPRLWEMPLRQRDRCKSASRRSIGRGSMAPWSYGAKKWHLWKELPPLRRARVGAERITKE